MKYNLWDTEIGKFLGQFATEDEALSRVRILVGHYGDDYAENLSLGREHDDGTILDPLEGAKLVARAEAATRVPG